MELNRQEVEKVTVSKSQKGEIELETSGLFRGFVGPGSLVSKISSKNPLPKVLPKIRSSSSLIRPALGLLKIREDIRMLEVSDDGLFGVYLTLSNQLVIFRIEEAEPQSLVVLSRSSLPLFQSEVTLAAYRTSEIEKTYLAVACIIKQSPKFYFQIIDLSFRQGSITQYSKIYGFDASGFNPP